MTLVLVDSTGKLLGALPPFTADTPAWLDLAPVVCEVQCRLGLAVTVLRLLHAERARPNGGTVSYLAEVPTGAPLPPLQPWHAALRNHLRPAHADAGGPAAELAWAPCAQAAGPRGRPPAVLAHVDGSDHDRAACPSAALHHRRWWSTRGVPRGAPPMVPRGRRRPAGALCVAARSAGSGAARAARFVDMLTAVV
ncbi:hypothetical protein [Ideonella sp. A 288]|uniref:hypothetical protein n=1 Tax=Ideonella sp. A 288 TaxID=1962181 RepID=UPI001186E889|nr:hypothetical protein [Ideonella sp. A 288]